MVLVPNSLDLHQCETPLLQEHSSPTLREAGLVIWHNDFTLLVSSFTLRGRILPKLETSDSKLANEIRFMNNGSHFTRLVAHSGMKTRPHKERNIR